MNYYRVYGLNICSEINFSENINKNSKSDTKKIDVVIKLGEFDFSSSKEIISNDLFRINKNKNDYFLYWKDIGTFKVSNGQKITVSPEDDVDEHTLNSYIMGPVLATLLYQRGFLVLHASAVKIGDSSVAFLGDSGIGKSTTAMALNKKGYPLITDDILVIQMNDDENLVLPGLPMTKLSSEMINFAWNNEITPKMIQGPEKRFRCAVSNFWETSLPLKRIYILENAVKSFIDTLKPQKALIELIHNSYCFVMFENRDKLLNLEQCSKLMNDITVRSLKVNKSIEELSELVKEIEDDLSSI